MIHPDLTQDELHEKLRSEVALALAADLLPHQRRGALLVLDASADLLDAAVAIAKDDTARVRALLESGALRRPTLAELADACVDTTARYHMLILQPYVLAQRAAAGHDATVG